MLLRISQLKTASVVVRQSPSVEQAADQVALTVAEVLHRCLLGFLSAHRNDERREDDASGTLKKGRF